MLNDAIHEILASGEVTALKHLKAVDDVVLENVELLLREATFFLKQIFFDELLADIEEESREHEVLTVDSVQSHPFCHKPAEDGKVNAVMEVVVPLLIHRVDHGDRRRTLFIQVTQTPTGHDILKNAHVEFAGDSRFLKELFHLRVDVAIVFLILTIQLYVTLGSRLAREGGR